MLAGARRSGHEHEDRRAGHESHRRRIASPSA
jgi:hypothetical protein